MLKDRWPTFAIFQKVLLCLLAAMTVLCSGLMVYHQCNPGVYFHDALLDVNGTAESGSYHGKSHNEIVNIVVGRESDTAIGVGFAIGDIVDDSCLVEYPLEPIQTEDGWKPGLRVSRNGHVLFEGAYEPGDYSEAIGYLLYDQTGQRTIAFTFSGHTYGGGNGYWDYYEPDVGEILYFADGPELTTRGDWVGFLAACFIALLAAVITVFPEELFRLKYGRFVENPEPTEYYYLTTRFGSVLFTGMAFIAFILALRALPAP